jgi:hypothetical protein
LKQYGFRAAPPKGASWGGPFEKHRTGVFLSMELALFQPKQDMSEEDLQTVRWTNEVFERLAHRRVTDIRAEGLFARSMLAWKIATYQQSLLYRVVALASGCALAFNAGNPLCAILSARALIETIAVASDFERQVLTALDEEDLEALNSLAVTLIFATRDELWLEKYPEHSAVKVLTSVEKFQKRFSLGRFLEFYKSASEFCHPNHAGHHQFFGRLDTTTGTVNFSETKDHSEKLNVVLAARSLLGLFESGLDRLDKALPKIADLQHRLNPAGDVAS